jgi:hypothetical protein
MCKLITTEVQRIHISVKVGIWCAASARIVGPVFFNETINCKNYV